MVQSEDEYDNLDDFYDGIDFDSIPSLAGPSHMPARTDGNPPRPEPHTSHRSRTHSRAPSSTSSEDLFANPSEELEGVDWDALDVLLSGGSLGIDGIAGPTTQLGVYSDRSSAAVEQLSDITTVERRRDTITSKSERHRALGRSETPDSLISLSTPPAGDFIADTKYCLFPALTRSIQTHPIKPPDLRL